MFPISQYMFFHLLFIFAVNIIILNVPHHVSLRMPEQEVLILRINFVIIHCHISVYICVCVTGVGLEYVITAFIADGNVLQSPELLLQERHLTCRIRTLLSGIQR